MYAYLPLELSNLVAGTIYDFNNDDDGSIYIYILFNCTKIVTAKTDYVHHKGVYGRQQTNMISI